MKLFLLLIIAVLIGILFFYDFSPKKMIQCVQYPIWFGPAGKLPPNPPVRWGYRRMCKKRRNC